MGKDNRKVLSPSGLTRGSTSNQLALLFNLDSRVKPENDSNNKRDGVWVVVKPEGDVIKRVPENDNTFVKGCHGWKRSGGAAVAMMSLSLVFCLGASEALAQCAVPPTCESLGYNKTVTECEGKRALKCPFDASKVFCSQTKYEGVGIGDIYYSDGTISDSVIAGKTPIGIVAYVNGNNSFVIALEETELNWIIPNNSFDLSCIPDLSIDAAKFDMNGKSNSACILSQTNATYPAAEYCNNYRPVTSGKGSSDWYLPAAGELLSVSYSYNKINLGLFKLSQKNLSTDFYWSSTEYDASRAWYIKPSDSNIYNGAYKGAKIFAVRCAHAI